jgi:hypothetical protein
MGVEAAEVALAKLHEDAACGLVLTRAPFRIPGSPLFEAQWYEAETGHV